MKVFLIIIFFATGCVSGFCQNLHNTSLPDLIPYRKGNLWGYCDKQKQLIIPAIYTWAYPFKKDLAWVHFDSLHEGVINKSGIVVCKVQKDTTLFVTDSGRVYIEYNKKVLSIRENDGFWFIPKKYSAEGIVAKDIYLAMNDGKYGLVDRNENVLLPFRYTSISDRDENGYFKIVTKAGKQGYINLKGEKLMRFKNKKFAVGSFSEGLAVISKRKGKKEVSGFMNRKGEIIIPMIYQKAYPFRHGLSEVGDNYKTGFINTKGDTVIHFYSGSPIRYPNGYVSYDLMFGSLLFDKEGNQLLRTTFDYLRYANDSVIIVGKKGPGHLGNFKYGIIDLSGREVWPCTNNAIYASMEEPLIYVMETRDKLYYMDYRYNKYYED